MTSIEDEQQV